MKKIKIALSLILAIALTSIMVLPAFAAGTQGCNCGHAPVIQVRGIGETLYDADDNEIFSTSNIVSGILPIIPQLGEFLLDTTNVELFVGAAESAVKTIFGPVMYDRNAARLAKDADGNEAVISVKCDNRPVEDYMNFDSNLTEEGKLSKALYDELGDDHVYFFTYDWTGNPVQIVKDLDKFIDEVKKQSGHDKVSINAESMGGAITSLYINTYGYGDIENLVMANSAFNGLEMLGQLFTGNVNIDGEALTYLLIQEILGNAEYAELVPYLPLFEQIVPVVNELMQNETVKAMIYDRIFRPVFGYMPSFWCLIPSYSFDAAKDYMFGEDTGTFIESRNYAGSNLLQIVNKVRAASMNTDQAVKEMVGYTYVLDLGFLGEQEIVVAPKINSYANVTNYNKFIAPVTYSANWNSDGVIEVYNASGWATAADMGYTLGEGYIQSQLKDVANYVSPDNVIDASTCQAPDNTWFIKNLGHINYDANDGTADFYVWLLTATEEYTINTNPEYPQFMYYDTIIPELMTWEEKESGGISLPGLDLEGLAAALDQILKGLGDMGFDLGDLDLGSFDLSAITGLLGNINLDSILGLLGSLDFSVITGLLGSLGGLLGGLFGDGGDETPSTPDTNPDDGLGDETPETPSTPDTNTNQNQSHVGSSTIDRTNTQTSGLVLSGNPVFSAGNSTWIILFAIAAVIAGILIIKL
ncbi:MAG: alpha/beta hydrolase [Clostridia bacterium]|nr:alpha/beta hydrolase [Clostridia bacterium]